MEPLLFSMVVTSVGNPMDDMIIRSRLRDFKVKFVDDFSFVSSFLDIPHHAILVGSKVYGLYKKSIFDRFPKEKIIVLELNEETKTIDTTIDIYRKLMDFPGKRDLTLISFGGGINQDLAGFVASTLYRGINWIYIPTTLLAMADSSIGLKTSLNFNSFKNVLGTFYPPAEVFVNVDFLKTLERKDYASGVGEIMKLLLMGKNAINKLEEIIDKVNALNEYKDKNKVKNIIKNVLQIKYDYMKGDEFDHGRRNLLNYGHEFGHALEPASSYQIPHGIAVVIGMIFANYISVKRGWLPEKIFQFINDKLFLPHIQLSMVKLKKEFFGKAKLFKNMRKDKKRMTEDLVLILPRKDLTLCKIQNLSGNEFESGLKAVTNILAV